MNSIFHIWSSGFPTNQNLFEQVQIKVWKIIYENTSTSFMTYFVQITIDQVSLPQVTLLLRMVIMSSWRVRTLHLFLTLLVLINGLRVVQVRQSVVNLHLHMILVTRGPLPDPILAKWFLRIVAHLLHPIQKLLNFIVSIVLWDPPSGPMYPFQSVGSSVCYKSSHTSHHQFLPDFLQHVSLFQVYKSEEARFSRKTHNFVYKQFFIIFGIWPFSWQRIISFCGNFIFRWFSTLSTTFLLPPWSGKVIFLHISVIYRFDCSQYAQKIWFPRKVF